MTGNARLKKLSILFLATGGFSGFFPVASGTAGTLVGVALVWALRTSPLPIQILVCLVLGGIGVWVCNKAGPFFREPDSGHIVIDEIVGMLVTMLAVPVDGYWLFWGFLIFRFFDIVKIPPAHLFDERVKNGWGVMMDDVVAGIYGNLLLHLMLRATL